MNDVYIAKKERNNKHGEKVYYFYLAESKRIEGVVKNIQRYMNSFKYSELIDTMKLEEKMNELESKFNNEEIELARQKIKEILYV